MTQIDLKIGEETTNKQIPSFSHNDESQSIKNELEYLNQKIRECEYKNQKKYESIKNILIFILICLLMIIIPDLIANIMIILFMIKI